MKQHRLCLLTKLHVLTRREVELIFCTACYRSRRALSRWPSLAILQMVSKQLTTCKMSIMDYICHMFASQAVRPKDGDVSGSIFTTVCPRAGHLDAYSNIKT